MKSFAVFVICASSVAMVAAAPPTEASNAGVNAQLIQNAPNAAMLDKAVMLTSTTQTDEALPICDGQANLANRPVSMSFIHNEDTSDQDAANQDVADVPTRLAAKTQTVSTRVRLERRMRESLQ